MSDTTDGEAGGVALPRRNQSQPRDDDFGWFLPSSWLMLTDFPSRSAVAVGKQFFSHRRQKLATFDDCTKFNGFFALQARPTAAFVGVDGTNILNGVYLIVCLTTELKIKSCTKRERWRDSRQGDFEGDKKHHEWYLNAFWWCSTSTSSSFRVTSCSSKWK